MAGFVLALQQKEVLLVLIGWFLQGHNAGTQARLLLLPGTSAKNVAVLCTRETRRKEWRKQN